MTAAKYQQQLLEQARRAYQETPLSDATVNAYLATLYADRPLTLFGDDDSSVPSTISQPSFVLRMLDLLQLESGHRVFELGAGSGWNAALIAQLVGESGSVHSLEIIPEIGRRAVWNGEPLLRIVGRRGRLPGSCQRR